MDGNGDQPTQATQPAVDPRRVGKQNSGFSDDDISDIICVLHPHSSQARHEVRRLAREDASLVIGRNEMDAVDDDYFLEDHASRFEMAPPVTGDHAIVLKLSSQMKSPLHGFAFGRNPARCDICFKEDPLKRLSNIHFRIYVNEYGVVMLEDQSTNGTIVDSVLLKGKGNNPAHTKRVLSSGSKINVLMHKENMDLEFLVRIPRRDGEHDAAYTNKLNAFFARINVLRQSDGMTITPGPGPAGPPNLFAAAGGAPRRPLPDAAPRPETTQEMRRDTRERMPREWDGSEKYNRVGMIGKGAFAVVYKVTDKFDGIPYAAKELDKRRFMKNGVLDQKVDNEMKIMQKITHPNIVRYIENFDWDNRLLIIIMEYVPCGDLGKFINERGPLPEAVVKRMASQMLSALGYLHQNNITHRDVKPDNILINAVEPWDVKLTDFGLSKMVDNEETFLRTFCGTLLYCAPEVYSEFTQYDLEGRRHSRNRRARPVVGQRYDHAVDIWSLGGVLFYALTGSPPYPVRSGISYSELLHQIMTTSLNTTPLEHHGVSRDCIGFLELMLQRRPEMRATVEQLQNHTWLGGRGGRGGGGIRQNPSYAESLDEITDEELEVNASQLSLNEGARQRHLADIEQTDFALTREDVMDDASASDHDSEKENHRNRQKSNPGGPRLFGEVNVSAIGSSGVIPEDRLNLPVSGPNSLEETVILGSEPESEIPDSFDDSDHFTPNRRSQPSGGGARLSIGTQNQSADQLQSLVHNVASQSLGGSDSVVGGVSMRSSSDSRIHQVVDFNTSKRKPTLDTSDEFEAGPGLKPTFKRLKSENNMESLEDEVIDEYKLLASVPAIQRLESGRQIDRPVHKTIFWDRKDAKTHHLNYPEMTQLQLAVFRHAAAELGHEFAPGDSPLWKLAMKHFPPTHWSSAGENRDSALPSTIQSRHVLRRDEGQVSEAAWDRMTAHSDGEERPDSLPDTLPPETQQHIIVPDDLSQNRMVAVLESAPDSVIKGVSLPVTDSMLSWGRGPENTHVFEPKTESMVPKYAFKIMLWREGYDAARDRSPHPWLRLNEDESEYHFYMSTKATNGIWVNQYHLQSHDAKKPSSPSHHWIRLHNGDDLVVWGADRAVKTRIIFKCFWGGSQTERSPDTPPLPVHVGVARRLDDICLKAEKRCKSEAAYKAALDAAFREHELRERFVETERERSTIFEGKRKAALKLLAARNASRRGSPSSVYSGGVRLG